MGKELKAIKEGSIKLLSHSAISGSGVYDAEFEVNGEVIEREFEVDVVTSYYYEKVTNYYKLKYATVSVVCCNEEDEDIADIMERKLEEAIEGYLWKVNE